MSDAKWLAKAEEVVGSDCWCVTSPHYHIDVRALTLALEEAYAAGRRDDVDTVEKFFLALRFNAAHHLGRGDVRVTLGQQDELITLLRALPPKDPK